MNRNQVNFNNLNDAIVQCIALSMYYPNGRHYVYKHNDKYRVQYDADIVRLGVDESYILYEARSNAHSGTYSYKECKDCAYYRVLNNEL